LLSGLQYSPLPPGAAEHSGGAAFDGPFHFPALSVVDRHIQPGVRIRPLPFLDYADECLDLIHLISRVTVVGKGRDSAEQHRDGSRQCDETLLHDVDLNSQKSIACTL